MPIKGTPQRPVVETDYELLERFAGGSRLWYIAGAHMAQTIDEKYGRSVLVQTITKGPDNFFEIYEEI
ncbi:MAG: DUF5700 domain-containing putative Zn-dependent protease [Candidatus Hermodarchaeota archaeon]